ncbi:MAG: trypsin-like peptidase domain-containing protein [Lachnospiraceae bacterium]|nr:trypsin-like peptidase domain-containing protein [Lachnospiraceae bacterium]
MNDNIYEDNMNVENEISHTGDTGNSGYEVTELVAEGTSEDGVNTQSEVPASEYGSNTQNAAPASEYSSYTQNTAPASDHRYDKYAAPASDNTSSNVYRAKFNPYTGERIVNDDSWNTNNAGTPAYGTDTVQDTASASTAETSAVSSVAGAPTQSEYSYGSGAQVQSEYSYGSAAQAQMTEFTYGSGAPTQTGTPHSTYVSSYGTIYNPKQSDPNRKKRHMPGWLKVILSAAAFGVIAAAVFIGTNKIYDSFKPSDTPTVNEDSASKKHNIINPVGSSDDSTNESAGSESSISQVKKGSSNDTVASAQVLTGNESTYTDVSAVVENSLPSIVQINCTFNTQSFFGTYTSTGAGSGIIIGQTDTELMIATNNHVVENALDVKVTFNDGAEVEAYVKGTDANADLAVVAVDLANISKDTISNIKVAVIGDSDSVKVGQMAIAIGNALGYGTSTTVGYISAKDREVNVDGKTMTLLQTDAAINPGNSGGALLNIKGEVIGINNVKYASAEVEGMGFAIPISRAVDILNELASREVLKDSEKGYLGVKMQTVTSDFANAYGWPTGVYVNTVLDGSAAEKAGILSGDIITKINNITVQTTTDLRNEITSYKAGTEVTITLQRLSRGRFTEMELKVTLGANPEYAD